jgi:ElaB/YqjD/DUF883 family membrane-anchored ribosome-binding protein
MESDLATDQQVENFSAEDQAEEVRSMVDRGRQYAIDQAKAADRTIRQYPYHSIGIAFGIGVLIGVLAVRR